MLSTEEHGALELELAAAGVQCDHSRLCYSHPFIAGEANDRGLPLEYARYVRGRPYDSANPERARRRTQEVAELL